MRLTFAELNTALTAGNVLSIRDLKESECYIARRGDVLEVTPPQGKTYIFNVEQDKDDPDKLQIVGRNDLKE